MGLFDQLKRGDVVRAKSDVKRGWMVSVPQVPAGTSGVVISVTWLGQAQVRWDTGVTLTHSERELEVMQKSRGWFG